MSPMHEGTTRTSILSISILPYCFLSSLFACFIASTVAIVFRRFSVASAADSMLNVCCVSCSSWDSYMRFCLSVRSARCWMAFWARCRSATVLQLHDSTRTFPGPFLSFDICSLYRASSPSSLRILTSMEDTRASVCPLVMDVLISGLGGADRCYGILQRRLGFPA